MAGIIVGIVALPLAPQLNGAATLASVQKHVWCETESVGERIAVRLIEGAQRAELLKSQKF